MISFFDPAGFYLEGDVDFTKKDCIQIREALRMKANFPDAHISFTRPVTPERLSKIG